MKIQNTAIKILYKALKKNKFRKITHDEFHKKMNDPFFMYAGTYCSPDWKLEKNEVGIDATTLERLILI